ncbi:Mrr restriction system protein [Marichromatium bheemlicum]|uniref:Mrr restriction system protein n=2 Tax=Marichromatium bheemlicum TaxID=365339 RepID=A0ABX1IB53_9GAMM|nr:Mrr restriction system protein [Marichromatium bheemlicum]
MTNGKKKAGVTRQRVGKLMRTLFEILQEHPDGIQAQTAIAELEQRVPATAHESGHYASGGRRYENIVRFSTVDLVKAGWLLKDKGIWSVTETGKEAFATYPDPTAFYKRACALYKVWKSAQPDPTDDDAETVADAEVEQASPNQTFEQAEEAAWDDIWDYLQRIDPYNLQRLVAGLLEAMGYHVSWIAPPGKDGGMDVLAWTDPLGAKPPRIKVQVKRRKDSIAVDELRAFMAVLSDNDVGLFVTTGRFTKDAHDEARLQERRKITLIDRERLVELWIQYMDRLSEESRQLLPLKPIYFLAPS